MQVDTLYLDVEELNALYYDGAGELPNDTQAVIRAFMGTVLHTEERYNKAASVAAQQQGMPDQLSKVFRARIHVHFVVEPA